MIEFLIISTVFFILGRWSANPRMFRKNAEETIDEIVEKARKPKLKPGVIPFKTPQDFEDERSGEKELSDHWENSGIADMVKNEIK